MRLWKAKYTGMKLELAHLYLFRSQASHEDREDKRDWRRHKEHMEHGWTPMLQVTTE